MKAPVKFDDYYLIERVAVGGMAEVFKGISYSSEGVERLTALKRVLPHIAEDKEFIEMFIDEAEIAAQLQHPNIGQVFHLGQSEGKYFIAMEFISGQDLRSLYDQARERQEHLDLGWCVYMIREVCEALDYAHRKRDAQQRPLHLIHRDVSPQNILMSYDGSVKLIDFGIAKANGKINQTQVGILKGKFSYMSPEQARGLQLDARSDLFALAVVLYEMVTLERCFYGQSDFSTIERVRNLEYLSPRKIRRDIPSVLEKIIAKGLAKDPNERYQSAADFQEALNRYLNKYAPQFSRSQAHAHMKRLFSLDMRREQEALTQFRTYAAQHIPEASRKAMAGGHGRFDPLLSMPRDESSPRLSQDGRLSINPSHDRPREIKRSASRHALPVRSGPSLKSRLTILITLGILAGGGAALFASAKAPRFGQLHIGSKTITPIQFILDGMGQHIEGQGPALISDLPSGEYQVQLHADGYQDSRFAVLIEADQKTPLIAEANVLQSAGFYQVTSTPNGAFVSIDGQAIGQTPLTLSASRGAHQLSLSLKGYEPLQKTVEFKPTIQELNTFILFPEQVKVTVIPSIKNAQISVKMDLANPEWRPHGMGEQTMIIRNTARSIVKIEATGYESTELIFPKYPQADVIEWVELNALKTALIQPTIVATVAPQVPKTVTSSPREVKEVIVTTPDPSVSTPEVPKKTTNTVKRPSTSRKRKVQKTVTKPPSKPKEESQPGFLKLITVPPVEVIYNGKSLGWTPLRDEKFPEGNHTLTLRLANGDTYKINQDISPGRSALRKWKAPK